MHHTRKAFEYKYLNHLTGYTFPVAVVIQRGRVQWLVNVHLDKMRK